jgi:hypothetical protein
VTLPLIRKAIVRAGSDPRRRANRPYERREPEQHECEVKALHPIPRHTVRVRRVLDGLARSVLVRIRLFERERVLDVGVPNLAFDEELLDCDLKDHARALAQPVGRITVGASACSMVKDGARLDGGLAVEASAANRG